MEKEIIQARIDNVVETLLSQIYGEMKIDSGDITPEQTLEWDKLVGQFATLFTKLIEQNQEEDLASEE